MEILSFFNFLYKTETLLFFISGIASLLLTVVIVFAKQGFKRNLKREELKKLPPEEVGDIDQKLNDFSEFKKLNFWDELTKFSIQPLLILSFVSLFSNSDNRIVCFTIALTLLTIAHEFYLADTYGNKKTYKYFILLFWIVFYVLLSIRNSQVK